MKKRAMFEFYLLLSLALNLSAAAQTQRAHITFDKERFGSVTLAVISGDKNGIGDITKQTDADIIVNAANATLLGGAGVDGAVHKAAGPKLKQYIKETYKEIAPQIRCEVGDMQETPAFDLEKNNVQFIFHTVAPDCRKKEQNKNRHKLLQSCYENCFWRAFWLADLYPVDILAFPSLSTGIYEYPLDQAAHIAISTITNLINTQKHLNGLREIRFVVWPENFESYLGALKDYARTHHMKYEISNVEI